MNRNETVARKRAGTVAGPRTMIRNMNRTFLFWIFQAIGWISAGIFTILVYMPEAYQGPRYTAGMWMTIFSGFLTSLWMRRIYRRIDYHLDRLPKLLLAVILFSFVAGNLWLWLDRVMSISIWGFDTFLAWTFRTPLKQYLMDVTGKSILLLCWSALYFGTKLWFDWHDEANRAQQADVMANTAQLQMLRYQLNPHFLFNALNTLRALIDEDPSKAKETVTNLSEFLRYSLMNKTNLNVALNEELEAVQHYLEIEKKRFEEKLQIEYSIDPATLNHEIPGFLIHPLVENAIKYGTQTSPMPLKIELSTQIKDGNLIIEIRNSGLWIEPGTRSNSTGIGLSNVRQRLSNAYPDTHEFKILTEANQVCVRITIPEAGGKSR